MHNAIREELVEYAVEKSREDRKRSAPIIDRIVKLWITKTLASHC